MGDSASPYGTGELFQPLEEVIQHQFLPALTSREALSNTERALLALPARHGGLGIPISTAVASHLLLCYSPPSGAQSTIEHWLPVEVCLKQRQVKSAIRTSNRNDAAAEVMALKSKLSNVQQCAMEQASEKGPLLGWPAHYIMNRITQFVYEDALEYFSPYAIYDLIIYTAAVLWTVWIGISVGLGLCSILL